MNCSPFKLRVIVGSAAPMEVYKSVNLKIVPLDRFVKRRQGIKEGTTHKLYGGQKDGQCEGENDAPELPVLGHSMRDTIGRFGGGWRGWGGWQRFHNRTSHGCLLVGQEIAGNSGEKVKLRGRRDQKESR